MKMMVVVGVGMGKIRNKGVMLDRPRQAPDTAKW